MPEIFQGWKRKVGCATLLMACALVLGWWRSTNHFDLITVRCGDLFLSAESIAEGVELSHQTVIDPSVVDWKYFRLDSNHFFIPDGNGAASAYSPLRPADQVDSFRSLAGFYFIRRHNKYGDQTTTCILPYWSIVLPLTLLSAYLFLSNPCPPTDAVDA